RSDGSRPPGAAALHELVPRLPPQSSSVRARPRRHHEDVRRRRLVQGVGARHVQGRRRPDRQERTQVDPTHPLLRVPPMSKRLPYPVIKDRSGQKWWRSLKERDESPEFMDALSREFPDGAAEPPEGVSRRTFFKIGGAAMALA